MTESRTKVSLTKDKERTGEWSRKGNGQHFNHFLANFFEDFSAEEEPSISECGDKVPGLI